MPYLKVIISAIQIASGAHFANPEGLIYSEQNLADGSVIASQQPLPLCGDVITPSPRPCVTYRNGDAHALPFLNGRRDVDEPQIPRIPIAIDTDGNGPCASGRAFINNSCLPLPYILKEQVESGSMTVKEWRKEMGQWRQYWKTHPGEELHGCTDNKGFDTGLCVTLPRE